MGFWGFFKFLIFYENNTNFSHSNRFFLNKTYNHYNYINLKPRFQNICAKNIGAHNMHKKILKIYTNIRTGRTDCKKSLNIGACLK
jgi:hypothetical protein